MSQEATRHDQLVLTEDMEHVWRLLETTRTNVLLTGKAGTGKSTFLQLFRKHTRKNMAVVAPTGVAALNVQGQTIHSMFRFPPRFIHPQNIKPDRRALFRKLDLLIIDEISMVRADVLDGINLFLQLSRQSDRPFGGVQVCMIGDVHQLPPVVSEAEQNFFSQYYSSPYFFNTRAYQQAGCEKVEFQTVHRQRDTQFIQLLESIRYGSCNMRELTELNERVSQEPPAAGTLILSSTNAIADRINAMRLAEIPDSPRTYHGAMKGQLNVQGARLPAPEELTLKIGAQVMFVKNDTQGRWVNGTLGKVEYMSDEEIVVSTDKGAQSVSAEKWQTIGYEWEDSQGRIVEKVLGTYTQIPLILAWAMTIHKSQGKTLDRVLIDLGRGAFAPGQLYVALSRCRSLANITLARPVKLSDMPCDTHVLQFTQSVKPVEHRIDIDALPQFLEDL